MAVLAVKPQGWRNAHEYPPIMSHIIKMARFMIIQTAFQDCPSDPAMDQEPDLLGHVTRLVDECMIRGSQCAMQWILDRRAYGMKIHYTSTSAGNVDWVGDRIRYKQIDLSMGQLRGMIHGLVRRTSQALESVLVLKEVNFPSIPWLHLHDDPTREGIGYNFVRDERNDWPVDGSTWLVDRLPREPGGAGYPIPQGLQHQRDHQGHPPVPASRGGRLADLGRVVGPPGVGHVAGAGPQGKPSTELEDLACRRKRSSVKR